MFRFVSLLALVGCGRFGFDLAGGSADGDARSDGLSSSDVSFDAVAIGHDEDGDGIRDVDDTCPHLVGAQVDTDGDKVGDLCDPFPLVAGDSIAAFYTMGPGDQPFTLGNVNDDGVWTQLADAVRFEGTLGGDNNLYGHAEFDGTWASVRVAMGIDLQTIVPGSVSNQNQIALSVHAGPPNYYIELNQQPGSFDVASITYYDGTNYSQAQSVDLANGMHPGDLFMQTTQIVNTRVNGEIAWPGEVYQGGVMDTLYQGATRIEMNVNNVHFEIRYLIIITAP
jgi:hypothetical protein